MSRPPDEDEPYYWGPANSRWKDDQTGKGEGGLESNGGKKHRQNENEHLEPKSHAIISAL